jgi:transposase
MNFRVAPSARVACFCLDVRRVDHLPVRRNLFWLSDEQWKRIEPHLPTGVRGVERADDRRVISGIVHVLKSGCRWCDCPPEYGPPTTIYNRFVRWARRGVWENLFRELAGNGRSIDTRPSN